MAAERGAPLIAPSSPELAIVLVTSVAANIQKVLRCYRAQTDPQRLEIVVVTLAGASIAPDAIAALGFPHVRLLASPGHDIARAEEQAIHAATAPWVVLAQPHGYPRPGFVDAVLAAARSGSWTVIGPVLANANPESRVSWAGTCIHHGRWSGHHPRGPATKVPGHHSAYDRRALLALGAALAASLPAGPTLQQALGARGGTLLLEPAAGIAIVNISRLGSYLRDQLFQAVAFARRRRQGWSAARRGLYAAGSPLFPALWLARIAANLRRDGRLHELGRGLPVLLAGLVLTAAGECLGYLVDWDVDATPRRADMALDRLRHLCPEDRRRELDEQSWPGVGAWPVVPT